MEPTKLIYLEDFTLLHADSEVLGIAKEDGQDIVILDQTVFYPQGGGQPYDTGIISGDSAKFIVQEVRYLDGLVRHIGKFELGSFEKGEAVRCAVDKERRELNSRIHSAGHVVDMAVYELKLNWIPGKGYHFPEGPYVEYSGDLEGLDKEKLKVDIENLCNKFIEAGRQTKVLFMEKSRMKEFCRFVPDYIPEGKPARVVMYGDFGIPCGGTHVSNLSEIKEMTIRKVKAEASNVRVAYEVNRQL